MRIFTPRLSMRQEKKRRPYKKLFATIRIEIAKYACRHGVALVARVFSRRPRENVSESTVHSIRDMLCPSHVLLVNNFLWWLNFRGLLPSQKILFLQNLTCKTLCPQKFVRLWYATMLGATLPACKIMYSSFNNSNRVTEMRNISIH